MDTVGFIGLGMMGGPMSRNLARAGTRVVVHDVDRARVAQACETSGVDAAASAAECASRADVLFTCLPSLDAIESVYRSADGVIAGVRPGTLCCELSTTTPELSAAMAAALSEKGARYAECTMIGPPSAAQNGDVFFIVGAEETDAARMAPLLQPMGRGWRRVGPVGTATRTKLLHNALGVIHAVATCEILGLCLTAGVDPMAFVDVVKEAGKSRGIGYSMFFDLHARDIAMGQEQGAGRLYIAAKDAHLARDFARALGYQAPMLAEADRMFAAAVDAGLADREFTAVARMIEAREGRTIFPKAGDP